MVAVIGLVIWGYFKNGTVYLAFASIKKQKYQKADKILRKTVNPSLLKRGQRSYYHFSKGFINLSKEDFNAAEKEFKEALLIGLRTENDMAIAYLNLAGIEVTRKNRVIALEYLGKMKELSYKKELQDEVYKLEEKLIEVGVSKAEVSGLME